MSLNKSSCNFSKTIAVYSTVLHPKLTENRTKPKTRKKKNSLVSILSKDDFTSLYLIGQFDTKFLIFLRQSDNAIVIFDQHAIHERILYEFYSHLLLNELYQKDTVIPQNNVQLNLFDKIFSKFDLNPRVRLNVNEFNFDMTKFIRKFQRGSKHNLFYFTFTYDSKYITLYSVPIIFDKVHKIEKLVGIFATLINDLDYYFSVFTSKSEKILNLFDEQIRSKACRNAIKFNDVLDDEYVKLLSISLYKCRNPFLCAHGRHNFFFIKKNI